MVQPDLDLTGYSLFEVTFELGEEEAAAIVAAILKMKSTSALAHVLKMSAFGLRPWDILSFFVNLLLLVSPLYMQQVYDRVLTTHHLDTLIYLTALHRHLPDLPGRCSTARAPTC